MKVVHKKDDTTTWMELAKGYESTGEIDMAISAYQHAIRINPRQETAYQRLMVLFRKQKKTEKELSILSDAIAAFSKFQEDRKQASNKTVSRLSKRIAAFTGLAGKDGSDLYLGQPLTRWITRKNLLNKKNNASDSKKTKGGKKVAK